MKQLTPTATVDGFRAVLLEDGWVPIFDGPMPLGRGAWNARTRRIDDMPERVPEQVRTGLSQGLKLAILASKVKKEEKRKEKKYTVSRPSLNKLFHDFRERAFPSNFSRWTKVKLGQTYVAIVIAETEAVLYREGVMIGKGTWNANTEFIERYKGEKIPAGVWERIAKGLTEYVVARTKS